MRLALSAVSGPRLPAVVQGPRSRIQSGPEESKESNPKNQSVAHRSPKEPIGVLDTPY